MTAATVPLPARRRHRLLGSPPCELTLSVATGEHQGRQMSIRADKCTIGSAKGCTLRLVAAGVGALHCWILRGSGGTIIRCRHPHTRLNGRPFRDAALMPGDRLQVGSVELEVQRCPLVPTDWTVESAYLPEVTEEAQSFGAGPGQSEFDKRRAAQQLSELNELVTRVSAERDALAQRLRTLESEAAGESGTLKLAKENLELSLAASQQQLMELRCQVAAREAEIESLLHAESRRVAETQGRLEQALAERATIESGLRGEVASLQEQSYSQQAECDRLQGECQRLETQLSQLRELVGYTAADRDRLTLQLAGDECRLIDQQQQNASEKSDLQRHYEQLQAELADAQRKLAVLEVQGDHHLQSEMQQAAQLSERLARLESEKSDLEARLSAQTAAWHDERESLRQQTLRVSDHSKQVEGQLGHVRELVESLAAERDKLCEQLEATEMRLVAEQEQFQQERAAAQKQVQDQQAAIDEWRRRAEESEQQLSSAGEQLSQATVSFASLREASQSRLHDESGRTAQMAEEAHAMRERLLATESQLADSQTRLAVREAESRQRQASDERRIAELTERIVRLEQQLAANEVQLMEAAERLSGLRTESETRLAEAAAREGEWQQQLSTRDAALHEQTERLSLLEAQLTQQESTLAARLESQREATADAQSRAAELQLAHAAIQSAYQELVETVQRDRDGWSHDRERLEQEGRILQQRLSEQQQELDVLREQAATIAAAAESTHGAMTLVLGSNRSEPASDAWNEHQRAAHETERRRLEERVVELELTLRDSQQLTQGMTLNAQELAALTSETQSAQAVDKTALLETHVESLQSQLAEAQAWRERFEEVQARLTAEQAEAIQRREQIEQLQGEIAALASQPAPEPAPPPAPPAAPADESAQLAALQAHEEEQRALAREREAVVQEQNQLQQLSEQHQRQREEFAISQAEFENRAREKDETLRAKEELLSRQAEELSQRLDQAARKLEEAEVQKAQLKQQQAALERQAELLLAKHTELAAKQTPSGTTPTPPAVPATAVSIVSPGVAAEVQPAADSKASPKRETTRPKPVWTQPSTPPPPADDDSIEAYMFRLLKRVRGDAPPPVQPRPTAQAQPPAQPPAPPPTAKQGPESESETKITGEGASSEPSPVAVEPEQPPQFLPRSRAPELTTNLAAMREVANSAARDAIAKHQRRTGGQKALAQSVGAVLTLFCATAAAYFAWRKLSIPAGVGAGIGLLAGLYWGGKAVGYALTALLLRPPLQTASNAAADEGEPAPEAQPAMQNSEGDSQPAAEEPANV